MLSIKFQYFILIFIGLLISRPIFAQQKKATTFQQQIQNQRLAQTATTQVNQSLFRIIAAGEYANVTPGMLNSFRSGNLWNSTTASQGTFSNLFGFNIGAGYYIKSGYLGIEFNRLTQELPDTLITSTTTSIQDSVELETLQINYDWVFQDNHNDSYEIGLSLGMATKFRYYNILNNNGTRETLYWQDTPFVAKVRGFYNYHFSQNVRFRIGLFYEYATSNNLKADSHHPTISFNGQPVTANQVLTDSQGSNLKVDLSGIRALAGLVVAF